jgi:hypothetical protein
MKTMIEAEESQDIEAVAGRGRNLDRLTERLPGLRDARIEGETGAIKVVEI